MKSRIAAAVLSAVFSFGQPLAQADSRAEKHAVAIEVLKAIDSKHLTQSMIELLTTGMMDRMAPPDTASKMSAEEKARFDKQMTQQRLKMRTMLDRLFARIDYAKYDAEVYLPIFEKEYTTDELRELVAFYKTKAGQKTAHAIPELSIGAFVHGMQLLQQDAMDVEKEMAKEEEDKRPQWDRTMRDIRTIATATEAYMTDENRCRTCTTSPAWPRRSNRPTSARFLKPTAGARPMSSSSRRTVCTIASSAEVRINDSKRAATSFRRSPTRCRRARAIHSTTTSSIRMATSFSIPR
jgi:hypothetical protein